MKDPIVQNGAPVLREKAKPVHKKDIGTPKLARLIAYMRAALAPEENGVALAAPQVGEALRIFVVAGKVFEKPNFGGQKSKVFINPELIRLSRKKAPMSEGCLSVRGKYGTVPRHEKASIRAWDENGTLFTLNGSGLLAQIFQHEVDHLEGVLFTDKAEHLEHESHEKNE